MRGDRQSVCYSLEATTQLAQEMINVKVEPRGDLPLGMWGAGRPFGPTQRCVTRENFRPKNEAQTVKHTQALQKCCLNGV
jgi:hypothetical protein